MASKPDLDTMPHAAYAARETPRRPAALSPSLPLALGALLLSAAGFYFGTGLHPLWWLTWLAPVPVLVAAPRLRASIAFLVTLAARAIGECNMWHYGHTLVKMPLWLSLVAILVPGCIFALVVLVYRSRMLRGGPGRAVWIVPALCVAFEYLVEFRSPHSTFGNLGYTQMNFPPILQIASVTGIWAISFCIFLFAATMAVLLSQGRRAWPAAIAPLAALIAVFAFGAWRLIFTPAAPTVRVGLVASDLPQNLIPRRAAALPVFEQYTEQVDRLAAHGAQVVVIPEKTAILDAATLPAFDHLLEQTAARNRIYLFAGVLKVPGTYNEIRMYTPAGTLGATYDKHHMLPAFESDEIPGTTRTLLNQPSGRWGLQICKDMDFPRLSREYSRDGAGLLIVPAWDFVADGWLHGRMAVLRGVESGFSIARSVKQGILSVTDDRGRVLAAETTGNTPFTTLIADVPVRHDATLYARLGDWFPLANLLAAILLLLAPTRRHRA
jgi:apolipoprotein N-acyltransferase